MSRDGYETCIFYRRTALGRRCVLMEPGEWRMRRGRGYGYCKNRGRNCSVLMNFLRGHGARFRDLMADGVQEPRRLREK